MLQFRLGLTGTTCLLTHLYQDIIQNIHTYNGYIHAYKLVSSCDAVQGIIQLLRPPVYILSLPTMYY